MKHAIGSVNAGGAFEATGGGNVDSILAVSMHVAHAEKKLIRNFDNNSFGMPVEYMRRRKHMSSASSYNLGVQRPKLQLLTRNEFMCEEEFTFEN
jgi:hypothetical protein